MLKGYRRLLEPAAIRYRLKEITDTEELQYTLADDSGCLLCPLLQAPSVVDLLKTEETSARLRSVLQKQLVVGRGHLPWLDLTGLCLLFQTPETGRGLVVFTDTVADVREYFGLSSDHPFIQIAGSRVYCILPTEKETDE